MRNHKPMLLDTFACSLCQWWLEPEDYFAVVKLTSGEHRICKACVDTIKRVKQLLKANVTSKY